MSELQARTIREARDGYVQSLSRKTKAALGREILFGGPASKTELITALVELRYPLAKLNEAIHVLYHSAEFPNDACEHCNA